MKIANKREFSIGFGLFAAFWITLAISMGPVFGGKNLLNVTDDLFNSVSKDSSDFIEKSKEEAKANVGTEVTFTTKGKDEAQTERIRKLFEKSGVSVTTKDKSLVVNGDLGEILTAAVDDAAAMFENNGSEIAKEYGFQDNDKANVDKFARRVLFDWEEGLSVGQKDLTKNDHFENSKAVQETMERAVEPAYNYYGIEASSPGNEFIPISLALIGYIIFTVWYGYSLLFMFEGWGLKLEH